MKKIFHLNKLLHLSIVCAFIIADGAHAEVKPNALFSDNAVFQQDREIPVWGTAKEGEKVTVTLDGDTESAITKDGMWMVRLKPHKAGGPFVMTIAGENTLAVNNVLVGEVWVCSGQSNMAFPFIKADNANTEGPLANYPKLRMFKVTKSGQLQPQKELTGSWVECSPKTVDDFSAVGYFFGRDIHKATGVPVGMIHSSVSGTGAQLWTSLSGLEKEPSLHGYVEEVSSVMGNGDPATAAKHTQEQSDYQQQLKAWEETTGKEFARAMATWNDECQKNKATGTPLPLRPEPAVPKPRPPVDPVLNKPTTLFNGKIAPIIPYAIRGVIWYQGEQNNRKGFEYRTLFPCLIADWREKWGEGDFPFLFVQLAPYAGNKPELREAQFLTWKKVPNTAMAVITDVPPNLHPPQKEPVGQRLALAARAVVYGEKIEYSGPEYDSLKLEGNKAILTFKHAGTGLVAKDGPLKGFLIAGADKKFIEAKAEIQGDTVVVTSDQVSSPVAVRYAFNNVPDGNLWNKEGLPASPFRTDPESLTQDPPEVRKPPVSPNRFEARTFKGSMELQYRLLKPKDFDPSKKYPLVIFFHGAGERGSDNISQLKHGVQSFASDDLMTRYPCFVIAPQCPVQPAQWVDTPWSLPEHTMPEKPSKQMAATFELINAVREEFPIDPARIYVTGMSMGGFATWDAIQRHPDVFAAGVPVCGGGDKALASRISKIPLWVFHGSDDRTVLTKRSQDMVSALKASGGDPKYTEYPGVGHFCWDSAYATKDLYDWLFAQHRSDPAPSSIK